eukprot:TRINITY_DN3911_c0_g1_i2.p1 TRINITY_DN3911_c0_g1~~TRINITY_DN3911_c0_g1_i2.p1  ORF type:complete len:913 (+),score=459.06 TRINITY_DN3911_c0_g1_i2:370-2739(+)
MDRNAPLPEKMEHLEKELSKLHEDLQHLHDFPPNIKSHFDHLFLLLSSYKPQPSPDPLLSSSSSSSSLAVPVEDSTRDVQETLHEKNEKSDDDVEKEEKDDEEDEENADDKTDGDSGDGDEEDITELVEDIVSKVPEEPHYRGKNKDKNEHTRSETTTEAVEEEVPIPPFNFANMKRIKKGRNSPFSLDMFGSPPPSDSDSDLPHPSVDPLAALQRFLPQEPSPSPSSSASVPSSSSSSSLADDLFASLSQPPSHSSSFADQLFASLTQTPHENNHNKNHHQEHHNNKNDDEHQQHQDQTNTNSSQSELDALSALAAFAPPEEEPEPQVDQRKVPGKIAKSLKDELFAALNLSFSSSPPSSSSSTLSSSPSLADALSQLSSFIPEDPNTEDQANALNQLSAFDFSPSAPSSEDEDDSTSTSNRVENRSHHHNDDTSTSPAPAGEEEGAQKEKRVESGKGLEDWGFPLTRQKTPPSAPSAPSYSYEDLMANLMGGNGTHKNTVAEKAGPVLSNGLIRGFGLKEDMNRTGMKRTNKMSYKTPGSAVRGEGVFQMEDAHVIRCPLKEDESMALFCIFDGHVDNNASFSAARIFPELLLSKIDAHPVLDDYGDILKESFKETDEQLKEFEYQGTTATAVLFWLNDGKRYVQAANVGDSCAFISHEGEIVPITKNHRVTDQEERDRLAQEGFELNEGQSRINGLALCRALGDHFIKEQFSGIISIPFVSTPLQVFHNDLLLMASDGLWDFVPEDEAFEIAKAHSSETEMARRLVSRVLNDPRSNDNVTVIAVSL